MAYALIEIALKGNSFLPRLMRLIKEPGAADRVQGRLLAKLGEVDAPVEHAHHEAALMCSRPYTLRGRERVWDTELEGG